MKTKQVTLTAVPPTYASDGSLGYLLKVTRNGQPGGRVSGWIYVGDDGRTVYATLDQAPWCRVGTVGSPAELTPAWIARRTAAILRPF